MKFVALKKGDIIKKGDWVADEDEFRQIGDMSSSIGVKWNKTAYYPMYRKIEEKENEN